MSNEQEPWLFDIRDFTIQLYADYNKPFTRIPIKEPVFHGFRLRPFFFGSIIINQDVTGIFRTSPDFP